MASASFYQPPNFPPPNFLPPKRYEVFTCFLGKGDKETFAYGMAAAREPYYVITSPPSTLGTTGERQGVTLFGVTEWAV